MPRRYVLRLIGAYSPGVLEIQMNFVTAIEGQMALVVSTKDGQFVKFYIDEQDAPFVQALGNWHPRYSQRPEYAPPVLRRRNSATGLPVEIRLPLAIAVLRDCASDEERQFLVDNYQIFLERAAAKKAFVQW